MEGGLMEELDECDEELGVMEAVNKSEGLVLAEGRVLEG